MSVPDSGRDPLTLLDRGMGQTLHWFPEDVPPTRLAEALASLANSAGGTVLLGASPRTGKIKGVTSPEKTLDLVFQATLIPDPPLVTPMPAVQDVQGHTLIRITIPAGLPHVYSVNGRYLGRDGRHIISLPGKKLRRLLLERGVFQFESQLPPDTTLANLDLDQIQGYLMALNLLAQAADPWTTLHRRGCLREKDGSLAPTYAGLLLFGHHPQQWLPSATILAARFPGETIGDQFIKQEFSGSLVQQIQGIEAFVRDNLRSTVRLAGFAHDEALEYPLEAVRELLINAVAHRDYNHQGDSIHLNIFSNHMVVTSPGGLPGPVNLENLLQTRFSRNPVIFQVLSDLGYGERLGYGLDRVVANLRRHDLHAPIFEEIGGNFCVTLHSNLPKIKALAEEQVRELNPRQKLALQHLRGQGRITNRAFRVLCPDVHPETLRRDLADLVQRGVLVKVGDRKATYYILKS